MLGIWHLNSPIGWVEVFCGHDKVNSVCICEEYYSIKQSELLMRIPNDTTRRVTKQLEEYFAGERKAFDLELKLIGTSFQRKVWDAASTIPFGEVRTYGDIATMIGYPNAARAVGSALGRNLFMIIVPCHRVVSAGGDGFNYAWGSDRKRWLLEHEGIL
jgi:methylated-DNA-[protein]-cysteine S-methyltransferase